MGSPLLHFSHDDFGTSVTKGIIAGGLMMFSCPQSYPCCLLQILQQASHWTWPTAPLTIPQRDPSQVSWWCVNLNLCNEWSIGPFVQAVDFAPGLHLHWQGECVGGRSLCLPVCCWRPKDWRAHIKLVPPSEPSQVFRPHKRSRYLVHSLPPLLSKVTCEGSPWGTVADAVGQVQWEACWRIWRRQQGQLYMCFIVVEIFTQNTFAAALYLLTILWAEFYTDGVSKSWLEWSRRWRGWLKSRHGWLKLGRGD